MAQKHVRVHLPPRKPVVRAGSSVRERLDRLGVAMRAYDSMGAAMAQLRHEIEAEIAELSIRLNG